MPLASVLLVLALPPIGHAMPADLRGEVVASRPTPSRDLPVLEVEAGDRKKDGGVVNQEGNVGHQGPVRYAVSRPVNEDLAQAARWFNLGDGRQVGQIRVLAPTAASIGLHFSHIMLPDGAQIWLDDIDGRDGRVRPVLPQDARNGTFQSPIVRTDELLVTIVLPKQAPLPVLTVDSIQVGVLPFGELPPPPQGSCNIDVVCPESAGWEAEIAAVGVYAVSGEFWCTGFLINNSAEDQTPYFATANHCGLSSSNDQNVTVYWNYESARCGDLSGGSLDDWQSGSTFRMSTRNADWALIELDDAPDPSFEVAWAGWSNEGTAPTSAVTIHHPDTAEKAISFEDDPTSITDAYSTRTSSSGTHIRITDWDLGTTEGGSSGSPLFDPNHRVVAVLTGGNAACGNNESDWYGRLATAWNASGSASGRLKDWLDPLNLSPSTVDTLAPSLVGVHVTPTDGWSAEGPEGGPFVASSQTWTLTNRDATSRTVTTSVDASFIAVSDATVGVSASGTATFSTSLTSAANALAPGHYDATLTVTADDGRPASTLPIALLVGTREEWHTWTLDSNPGWSTDGDWAFGAPQGNGGEYGSADPRSGATGANVYGYNLSGDYDNNMRAQYLTMPSLDLRGTAGVTLSFQRWLGVEEPAYDSADIEVSTDGGSTWTIVWSNSMEITDRAWVPMEVDLSALADNQPDVRIRWGMGSTDRSARYCGWNIDDISIFAVRTGDWYAPDEETPDPDTGDVPPDDSGTPIEDTDDTDTTDEDGNTDSAAPEADLAGGTEDGKVSGCACSASPTPRFAWLVGLLGLGFLVRRRA